MFKLFNEDSPWGPDGDRPGCEIRCAKCNQLRLFGNTGSGWCRRCRYIHYDEYFGPGGVNEQAIKNAGLSEPP